MNVIKQYTPLIFPEILLDIDLEGCDMQFGQQITVARE